MTNVEKKQLPAFLVLTIISLVAAVVLAATNAVTKGPIAEHARKARLEAFGAVLPAADYKEVAIPEGHASVTSLYEAVDENGASKGYTVVAAASGYAGPVAVTLGVGSDGMVTGAVIGDTSFAETAGFGMRWKEETDRWEQFKTIDTANGGAIEAISGATVTSGAVLTATNAAINCVNELRGVEARNVVEVGEPAAPVVEQAALTGGIHEGGAQGYQSEVLVQLTMDDANVITGLNINSMGETMGFGTRATTEASFAEQFVGKSAPFTLGDGIDALAGATVTSTAVVEAVNEACAAPVNPDAVPFDLGGGEEEAEEPSVEASADPVEPTPAGTLTAAAPGFVMGDMGGDVTVNVTMNEDGTIATLSVDVSNQTPGIGDKCADEAWLGQFIGKKGPFVAGENGIDVITNSTMTSTGIINALNSLFAGAPAAETLTAAAPGFVMGDMGGDVTVNVTLNEDGTIATLSVDVSNQTPGIGDKCADEAWLGQFIGKKGPFVAGENGIDVITNSTMTSTGIINALNSLFAGAPAAETLTAAAPGFVMGDMGGDVTVNVTLNEDGTIATLSVDVSNQTPGIGDKCADEAWLGQFIGKKGPFVAGENGIDVITNSTMTSTGIINALNSLFPAEEAAIEAPAVETEPAAEAEPAVDVTTEATTGATATADPAETEPAEAPAEESAEAPAADVPTQDMSATNEEGPVAPDSITITKPAFAGQDVIVTVTFAEDGTIAALTVDASSQSAGLGLKCGEERFTSQFIGKSVPLTIEDIDVVSYATITCQAVVDAVNEAAAGVPTQDMSVTGEEGPVAPNAATITKPAFAGQDVIVTVTFAEDGTIAALTVDASSQSAGLGLKCGEERFTSQFIGKAAPLTIEDIDVVSYATITCQAVVDAVNEAAAAQ